MSNAEFPLLSLIMFTPLVGAIILLFVSKQAEDLIRWIANITVGLGFVVSLPLWFSYDSTNPDWQWSYDLSDVYNKINKNDLIDFYHAYFFKKSALDYASCRKATVWVYLNSDDDTLL